MSKIISTRRIVSMSPTWVLRGPDKALHALPKNLSWKLHNNDLLYAVCLELEMRDSGVAQRVKMKNAAPKE